MWECTFIFEKLISRTSLLALTFTLLTGMTSTAIAQGPQIPPGSGNGSPPEAQPAIPSAVPAKKEDPGLFEQSSPYLEYGDFNLSDDEEQETLYYQYGRFFGVSVGVGYQTATGNRGRLYESAFPRVDVKVHYWFNFNVAMNFGVFFANHSFLDGTVPNKVSMVGFNVDLKYYFDVKNMGAALTFANPYLTGGVGALSKTQSSTTGSSDQDATFSVGAGGGLEFPIVYKSTYFILEAKYFTQNFADTNQTKYAASRNIEDLSGGFYTIEGHLLFTW